nr:unnamed protein product [Callosobruchus chinensis]
MDVEPGMLLKLRRLECKLNELVDKIDKEIIQTDVEWMHLKHVVGTTAQASECKSEPKPESKVSTGETSNCNSTLNIPSTSKFLLDEEAINASSLELDIKLAISSASLMEEFDSD